MRAFVSLTLMFLSTCSSLPLFQPGQPSWPQSKTPPHSISADGCKNGSPNQHLTLASKTEYVTRDQLCLNITLTHVQMVEVIPDLVFDLLVL